MVIHEDLDIPRDINIDIRHPRRLQEYKTANITAGWTADELRHQMFMDEIRGNDWHYRFTRTLRRCIRFLAPDGNEYLRTIEELKGKSPIGNEKSYIIERGVFLLPKATSIAVPTGTESFRSETIDITSGTAEYDVPFTKANVDLALQGAPKYPESPRWGVNFTIQRSDMTESYDISKHFDLWLNHPDFDELYEAAVTNRFSLLGGAGADNKLANELVNLPREKFDEIIAKAQSQRKQEENLRTNKKN